MKENIFELIETLKEILDMSDEFFERSSSVLIEEITRLLGEKEMEKNINTIFQDIDRSGVPVSTVISVLKDHCNATLQEILELKQKYTEPNKNEFIDKFYSLVESFFAYVNLKLISREENFFAVEFCHPNAKLPNYAHEGDQGADVYAVEDITILPHTYGNKVSTGLKIAIPSGWAISIRPRSGMSAKTPLRISNSPATIDQLYRGEIIILFDNFSDEEITIKAGDRIAQLIIEKNYTANYYSVPSIDTNTDRGENGFGSTGN